MASLPKVAMSRRCDTALLALGLGGCNAIGAHEWITHTRLRTGPVPVFSLMPAWTAYTVTAFSGARPGASRSFDRSSLWTISLAALAAYARLALVLGIRARPGRQVRRSTGRHQCVVVDDAEIPAAQRRQNPIFANGSGSAGRYVLILIKVIVGEHLHSKGDGTTPPHLSLVEGGARSRKFLGRLEIRTQLRYSTLASNRQLNVASQGVDELLRPTLVPLRRSRSPLLVEHLIVHDTTVGLRLIAVRECTPKTTATR